MPAPLRTASSRKEKLELADVVVTASERIIAFVCMFRPEFVHVMQKHITSTMIHDSVYKTVFETAALLGEQGKHIDFASIIASRTDPYVPEDKIMEIAMEGSDMLPVGYSLTEQLVETHSKLIKEAYARHMVYQGLVERKDMDEVARTAMGASTSHSDKVYNEEELAKLVFNSLNKEETNNINFPWDFMNRGIGGIFPGQFIIVAARPGTGKTIFCENVASYAAMNGKKVLFASAEMSAQEIVNRVVTRRTGIKMVNRVTPFSNDEKMEIFKAMEYIATTPLTIYEFSKVGELQSLIKEGRTKYDLVVVDYLQRLSPMKAGKSQYDLVTFVANELTTLAKESKIPFLVAAQFNRVADKNQPQMSDLRESGQIEQNADLIISLWRNGDEYEDEDKKKVKLDVLKNRNGPVFGNYGDAECSLMLKKKQFKFEEP